MNISIAPPSFSPAFIGFRTSFLSLIGLLIITGNIISIAVTHSVREIADSTKVLMTSLAIYDLLVGLLTMIFVVTSSALNRWPFGDFMCQTVTALSFTALCMSGVSLIFLNIERCIAVTRPYRFPVWCSRRRVITLVFVTSSFILTAACVIPFIFETSFVYINVIATCFYDNSSALVNILVLVFLQIIPIILMSAVYYRLIKISRGHERRQNNGHDDANNHYDNKALKTFLAVTLTFSFCFLPVVITRTVQAYTSVKIPDWLLCTVYWLSICNSGFNVFIYCLFNRSYRRTAKKMIVGLLPCCKGSVAPMNIQL
ncbi:beta-1 adrenergic receptor-like [Patiria miniata]|uniref:G-protein coupled receptors family 1 profile domain-containing protein n=1 Tax=Patiria miniata TaxID=46514 RepID=A0A914B0S4_PATMI|nr:beta-1 adrenergic receptor-like [Patiria miniata]